MNFLERHPLLTTLAIGVALILGIGYLAMLGDRYQCTTLGRETNRETKYVGAKCYVQQNGQWVREDELAVRGKR
ncbi:putative membrane protein [Stenotrophomonas phage Silvanus]|nr:putative membrane protein [Stenotrophomonas phage Silvanus]